MNLTDILTPEKWLEFDMDFYERTGMNAYAFDLGGERIAGHKKWANQLCPVIKGNPGKAANICGLSHSAMAETAKRQRRIVVGECEAGMLKICLPVVVDGEFVGIVGGCGLLSADGEVDVDVVNTVTGMTPEIIMRLAGGIRRLSKEEIEEDARYLESRIKELDTRKKKKREHTDIKTFDNLIAEVHRKGLCHQCGGCVTFCSAMNYGALELSETGRPRYRDRDKCIACGVCYMICPVVEALNNEMQSHMGTTDPMGMVEEVSVLRARDKAIRDRATDGGVVTAILSHLMEQNRIDGAAITYQTGPFKRVPWLATTISDILESAGSNFDRSTTGPISLYNKDYSSYSPSIRTLGAVAKKGLERVALVGTPCQVTTVRKMQILGVVPADSIQCILGLFCSGNYIFGDNRGKEIERIGGFKWSDVDKVNIKEDLMLHLKSGRTVHVPLAELDFVKRNACRYCDDYAARYADISFGGIGAEDGWTTVVVRTPVGKEILHQAKGIVLEEHPGMTEDKKREFKLHQIVERHAELKARAAARAREELENK